MNETKKLTPLSELGEFGLIRELTKNIQLQNVSSVKGIGDDAAVIDTLGKHMVVTTDMLTEGIHFDLMYTPLKHLGYKAVVVNLSDIYAMNAVPEQITVSIAVSKKMALENMKELYEGMLLACQNYGVDLVGGDTTTSLTGLTISITAIGRANPEAIVYRNGAKVNDIICVSGDLGAAYLGLQLLEREKQIFISSGAQPQLEKYTYVVEHQLKPEARKDVIDDLGKLKIKPNAMIDISDGLSSELIHICQQSGVGCRIYQEKIPIDFETAKVADEMNINLYTCALNGGEDYELLFTAPLSDYDVLKEMPSVKIIGHIVDASEGMALVTENNQIELKAQGWNPIKD